MTDPDPRHLQAAATHAYGQIPYQLGVHPQTFPDRIAAIAMLAGVDAPPIATARVLEVGGGTGLSALALAAGWPDARVTSVDIDPAATALGAHWATAAGLENASVRCADLLDAAAIEGPFDYVSAHGVFAWVPRPVADGLLALIARVLAPTGVAFVSYNALPGSTPRLAIRDRMLRGCAGLTDPAERLAAARAALAGIDADSDTPMTAAFARAAAETIEVPDAVLLHDELGDVYEPAHVADVVARARAHGLEFLGDSSVGRLNEMFGGDADPVLVATDADWRQFRSFRQTLLVRHGVPVTRTPDLAALRRLWVASAATETAPGEFGARRYRIAVGDRALGDAIRRLIAVAPGRVAVGELGLDEAREAALVRLVDAGIVSLHAGPAPFTLEPAHPPIASALTRLAIAQGLPFVPALDGRALALSPDSAAVVAACDGGDPARLEAAWDAAGMTTAAQRAEGLRALATQGVFIR